MLAYLEGSILALTTSGAIIQVGPVGYEVTSARLSAFAPGTPVKIYTVQHFSSDNQQLLLGFESLEARDLYFRLVKVPGIGPKSALKVIESASLESLRSAIIEGDLAFFSRVKGLGKKSAQKILLELKNTLVESSGEPKHPGIYEALRALRFTTSEIDTVLSQLDLSNLNENQALKLVLQSLGK